MRLSEAGEQDAVREFVQQDVEGNFEIGTTDCDNAAVLDDHCAVFDDLAWASDDFASTHGDSAILGECRSGEQAEGQGGFGEQKGGR